MNNHLGDTNKMVGDTPRTDEAEVWHEEASHYHVVGSFLARQLERELNAANERIKRLEEALDLVIPNCSWVHHSKKHQHKCGEPCPVVALIEKSKEAKL